MPEPTDPRILALAKARQQLAHDAYGSTARWTSLKPDEQRLFLEEAEAWLRAAIEAGIAAPADGVPEQQSAESCRKCGRPFDRADARFDGHGRHKSTPFCRSCVDRCHDSTDAFHRCPVCAS